MNLKYLLNLLYLKCTTFTLFFQLFNDYGEIFNNNIFQRYYIYNEDMIEELPHTILIRRKKSTGKRTSLLYIVIFCKILVISNMILKTGLIPWKVIFLNPHKKNYSHIRVQDICTYVNICMGKYHMA